MPISRSTFHSLETLVGAGGANEIIDALEGALPGITLADGQDIVVGTTTGSKIATATDQKLGFYNTTPVVQGAALTAQLTTLTHTAPGADDFAIASLTTTTPFGFVSANEGHTVLKVIANLQARLAEVEARLESIGLIAAN